MKDREFKSILTDYYGDPDKVAGRFDLIISILIWKTKETLLKIIAWLNPSRTSGLDKIVRIAMRHSLRHMRHP